VSYRPVLTGRALAQFQDLIGHQHVYDALMGWLLRLVDAPWDAWLVHPGGSEPDFRETDFGKYGLLSFRVDEQEEMLIIFNILWTGG
jgi:hypothetical protein